MFKSLDDYTKEDWLIANTHGGLDPESEIYRIFRVDFLLKDLREGTNTLVNPCYETQGDDLENPLKHTSFKVDGADHRLFRGMMAEYYAQSWSLDPVDWGTFGEGHDVIRVRVKAGRLFDRLMDQDDPFCSLYYHIGIIAYDDAQAIRDQLDAASYCDFLDSRGYGLLKTVMKIRSDFQKEKEVRLVYIRSPRDGYNTPLKHAVFGDQKQFCSHQYDWTGVIEGFELGPKNRGAPEEIQIAIKSATRE